MSSSAEAEDENEVAGGASDPEDERELAGSTGDLYEYIREEGSVRGKAFPVWLVSGHEFKRKEQHVPACRACTRSKATRNSSSVSFPSLSMSASSLYRENLELEGVKQFAARTILQPDLSEVNQT